MGSKNVYAFLVSKKSLQDQLGQLSTEAKSNEITAFPLLIEMLDLKGTIVTIDAAGCQKNIAHQIRDNGGDYVLALKGNQGKLHDETDNFFQQALLVTPEESGCDYYKNEEQCSATIRIAGNRLPSSSVLIPRNRISLINLS